MQRVDRLFADLGAPGAVVALGAPVEDRWLGALTLAEHALVARALPKRQREFATGRGLARAALAELGHRDVELLNGPDRAPLWPRGVAGSISHCDHVAVVAVTDAAHASVGVDVEHRELLKLELWKSVFLPREIEALERDFDTSRRGRMALVLFSAKEALYKAQYPRTTTYMGFSELHVAIAPDRDDPRSGRLVCTFQNDVGASEIGASAHTGGAERFAKGFVAEGRYLLDATEQARVVTSVLIPRARG